MSEDALERRITVIERAKGKHAVIKMRHFARVLALDGYDRLAPLAVVSLKRLIDALGDAHDPESDGERKNDGDEEDVNNTDSSQAS